MAGVTIRAVHKYFGSTHVIRGVDVAIDDGEFCVLVGPSGCGKSTLLRMIAGLEEIGAGEISIGGYGGQPRAAQGARHRDGVPELRALSAHDGARQHVVRADAREASEAPISTRAWQRAADILGLVPYLDRYPRQLSGGQRQRVAMGRAIVRDPQVFLFDEPLSNLDAKLRVQMRTEIKELHQRLRTTSIYVTHDQIEAMTMADKIVVMTDGVVEQIGAPLELYDRPRNTFVAGFIGSPAMNMIPGVARVSGGRDVDRLRRRDRDARRRQASMPMRVRGYSTGCAPSTARSARRIAGRGRGRRTHRRRHAALLSFQRPGGDGDDRRSHRLPARRPNQSRPRHQAGAPVRRCDRASPRGVRLEASVFGLEGQPPKKGGSNEQVRAP